MSRRERLASSYFGPLEQSRFLIFRVRPEFADRPWCVDTLEGGQPRELWRLRPSGPLSEEEVLGGSLLDGLSPQGSYSRPIPLRCLSGREFWFNACDLAFASSTHWPRNSGPALRSAQEIHSAYPESMLS